MYMPSQSQTCRQGPLPAEYAFIDGQLAAALTRTITAAQGAFDLQLYRPDLGPDGMPWDISGAIAGFGPDGVGIIPVLPGGVTGTGNGNGGVAGNSSLQTATGGNAEGYVGGRGSASNPRVIDFPYCTPLSLAARYVPPAMNDECGGPMAGNYSVPLSVGTEIVPPSPVASVRTPPQVPRPLPTGNVCMDLQNGLVLQSQVDPAQVYACAQAGYRGVQPSPNGIVQAAIGMGGLGECGDPGTQCAGNPALINPLGCGTSPAERARQLFGDDFPWWLLLAGVAAIYAVNKSTSTSTSRGNQ